MAACRSSSKNIGKMNIKSILNKTSPQAHTDLEYDVLGIPGKLIKYSLRSKSLKCFDWNTNIKESVRNL
jgi:hypothetical protein